MRDRQQLAQLSPANADCGTDAEKLPSGADGNASAAVGVGRHFRPALIAGDVDRVARAPVRRPRHRERLAQIRVLVLKQQRAVSGRRDIRTSCATAASALATPVVSTTTITSAATAALRPATNSPSFISLSVPISTRLARVASPASRGACAPGRASVQRPRAAKSRDRSPALHTPGGDHGHAPFLIARRDCCSALAAAISSPP